MPSPIPNPDEELLLKQQAPGPHYQIVPTTEGSLDVMVLDAEPASHAAEATGGPTRSGRAFAYDSKALTGVTTIVDVPPPNGIERSAGNAPHLVDKRFA